MWGILWKGCFWFNAKIETVYFVLKGRVHLFCCVHGQVRALFDDCGNRVDEAGPSIPVQVCVYSYYECMILSLTIILMQYVCGKIFSCILHDLK